jgi:hypothetical protein
MLATHKIHFVQIEQHEVDCAYYEDMKFFKTLHLPNQVKITWSLNTDFGSNFLRFYIIFHISKYLILCIYLK